MNAEEIAARLLRFQAESSQRLHLIASENQMPEPAWAPYLTEALSRYCFGNAGGENWAWPGRGDLAELESAAARGIGALLGARYVNVKPISGLSAMTVALSALAGSAGTVFSLAESDGGHGSTAFVARRFGLHWQPLPFDPANWCVDVVALARQARCITGPVLVYLDSFMALFPHDIKAIRDAVGDPVTIHYDGSHTLGLIAGGVFQDPLAEGADSVGGSVHKTWPGPTGKGIVATNDAGVANRIDDHAAGWISHSHLADTAALAFSVAWMTDHARDYATAVVANARRLAAALTEQGFTVCAAARGYTQSHQVWVDINRICPAETASRLLYDAGIVVNAIDIPYLNAPGLRLGVQELTFTGLDEHGVDELAVLIACAVIHREPPESVARAVAALRARYTSSTEQHAADEFLRVLDLPEVRTP
ncbi:hypothetical protein AB0346_25430 [Nocardia beijingensis]|uniref:hypothetical protein n=1 Tax=Nocardia beijingensis TaxID=95162 RepID=UPI00344EB236